MAAIWEEGTEFLECKPCSSYSHSPEVPHSLRKVRNKNFGFISKVTDDGEKRKEFDLAGTRKRHAESNLHKWCYRNYNEEKVTKKTFEEENEEVGLDVIKAYLKTARRSGSAADFMADINYLHQVVLKVL